MRYAYAISALRDKRARLAGEIEATTREMRRQRAALANLDAAIQRFPTDLVILEGGLISGTTDAIPASAAASRCRVCGIAHTPRLGADNLASSMHAAHQRL